MPRRLMAAQVILMDEGTLSTFSKTIATARTSAILPTVPEGKVPRHLTDKEITSK